MVEGNFDCPHCGHWICEYFDGYSTVTAYCENCGSDLGISEYELEVSIAHVNILNENNLHLDEEEENEN